MCPIKDSNLQPPACKSGALLTELIRPTVLPITTVTTTTSLAFHIKYQGTKRLLTRLYENVKQSFKVSVVIKHLSISSTFCGRFVFLSPVCNVFIFNQQ